MFVHFFTIQIYNGIQESKSAVFYVCLIMVYVLLFSGYKYFHKILKFNFILSK